MPLFYCFSVQCLATEFYSCLTFLNGIIKKLKYSFSEKEEKN